LDFKEVRPGHVASSQKTIRIHISELQIGMYVSQLDRPWLETPFLMQGFLIESMEDIAAVAEYSEHVWVDAVHEEWVAPAMKGALGKTNKTPSRT
jgi:hypothetical protein